ncbi:MAG TPA: hypothetical protein PLJ37_00705 [Chitinophagales bacterium]|nr:hypothetical protein [Chitinophagales bacterium]HMW93471.1 hypothetical protein [Chitinophagales bacterium]HMZ92906.1 hypothetical protein [Chitinophagales bacterium]HNG25905.1 hypothetical protein [Chitinophagales bacterium]
MSDQTNDSICYPGYTCTVTEYKDGITLSNENNKSVFLFWQYWTLLLLPIIALHILMFIEQRKT